MEERPGTKASAANAVKAVETVTFKNYPGCQYHSLEVIPGQAYDCKHNGSAWVWLHRDMQLPACIRQIAQPDLDTGALRNLSGYRITPEATRFLEAARQPARAGPVDSAGVAARADMRKGDDSKASP